MSRARVLKVSTGFIDCRVILLFCKAFHPAPPLCPSHIDVTCAVTFACGLMQTYCEVHRPKFFSFLKLWSRFIRFLLELWERRSSLVRGRCKKTKKYRIMFHNKTPPKNKHSPQPSKNTVFLLWCPLLGSLTHLHMNSCDTNGTHRTAGWTPHIRPLPPSRCDYREL